eukprot:3653425-Pleurochrysis_carterae.AAC.1
MPRVMGAPASAPPPSRFQVKVLSLAGRSPRWATPAGSVSGRGFLDACPYCIIDLRGAGW